jgi:Zn-dependent M16 (insulinase) family peptidase
MSIDTTIKDQMSADYFELFSASLGMSESTGYNWIETSDTTMNEQMSIEVRAEVSPGKN